MGNSESPLEMIARLGNDLMSGVHVKKAADDKAIQRMQASAYRDLGEQVPEEYVALLRVSNGVQINGAYFKSAEHLVLENLDVLQPEIILLGNEGNVADYVFDRRDRRFHIINMGSPDDKFESFNSFVELLAAVLQSQQVQ